MEPTDKIELTMQAQEWNTILAVMAKAPVPYEVTAPLIAELQRQCAAQQQQAGRPTLVEQPAAE